MSLIEQAAKRLEQLRQAGVELPEEYVPHLHSEKSESIKPAHAHASAPQDIEQARPIEMPVPNNLSRTFSNRVEIDLDAISASGLLVPQATRSQLADEYRVIKRPLIANAMGRSSATIQNGNLIMITSALPGEGKSFTAINLAISIAMELDNTVMLVDADVSRPSVLNMLGLPPAAGLLDVVV